MSPRPADPESSANLVRTRRTARNQKGAIVRRQIARAARRARGSVADSIWTPNSIQEKRRRSRRAADEYLAFPRLMTTIDSRVVTGDDPGAGADPQRARGHYRTGGASCRFRRECRRVVCGDRRFRESVVRPCETKVGAFWSLNTTQRKS